MAGDEKPSKKDKATEQKAPKKEKAPAEPKAQGKPADQKAHGKEEAVNLKEFIQGAEPQQLLQIARQTTLAHEHLVRNFESDGSPTEAKTDGLRKLLHRQQKNHADLRHVLTTLVKRSGWQGQKAAK
ncbi:MAG TPA: hypothetical protein VFE78_09375 [Gemmataceae bacterium]|jgi:hypothetical protein|nr:hypothetical protein [Gemmataceae bacterium]